jgi:hypothetical protein
MGLGKSRTPELRVFLDALLCCLKNSTLQFPDNAGFTGRLFSELEAAGPPRHRIAARRVEACAHLSTALTALEWAPEPIKQLGAAFSALEPYLAWSKRPYTGPGADRFAAGHGNALVIGPQGVEECPSGFLGVSLMAPATSYPEHSHPPDELYLALSAGQWRQGEADWFSPGIGGAVRNPPGISHAMRSMDKPLLAIWGLIP